MADVVVAFVLGLRLRISASAFENTISIGFLSRL
jgi:hypothetical protein